MDHSDVSAKLFPPIQGPHQLRRWAQISPIGLPMLFIVTWLIIVAHYYCAPLDVVTIPLFAATH
jgi:uncharacterized membrane protein YhdT